MLAYLDLGKIKKRMRHLKNTSFTINLIAKKQ